MENTSILRRFWPLAAIGGLLWFLFGKSGKGGSGNLSKAVRVRKRIGRINKKIRAGKSLNEADAKWHAKHVNQYSSLLSRPGGRKRSSGGASSGGFNLGRFTKISAKIKSGAKVNKIDRAFYNKHKKS